MRNKTILFLILCMALIFSGCFSPWAGDEEGILTISVGGNGQARSIWVDNQLNQYETDNFLHIVTITGPGGQKQETKFIGSGTASFFVIKGSWHVDVKAYNVPGFLNNDIEHIQLNDNTPLVAVGSADVIVKEGNNSVSIKMVSPEDNNSGGTHGGDKYTLTVGVIRGQDGNTLTLKKFGSVSKLSSETNDITGTTVTIKVSPASGYEFVEWRTKHRFKDGAVVNSSVYTRDPEGNYIFTITEDTEIFARFKDLSVTKTITNETEMSYIGYHPDYPLDGKYDLIEDLDFNTLEKWIPIGNGDNPFVGTFDGMGHTINLGKNKVDKIIDQYGCDYAGLFGVIGDLDLSPPDTVKNLILNGEITVAVQSNELLVGAVAGMNMGHIKNVVSSVTIKNANNSSDKFIAGGIAGDNEYIIENCASTATIGENGKYVQYGGGIAGYSNFTTQYCWADGSIYASSAGSAGGIAGIQQYDKAFINNCVALNSQIICSDNNDKVGRIVGQSSSIYLIDNYAVSMSLNGNTVSNGSKIDKNGANFNNTDSTNWLNNSGPNWTSLTVGNGNETKPWQFGGSEPDFRPRLWFQNYQ